MDDAAARPDAPPAVLSLDSGEQFEINGLATIGADADCTHRLPITPGEFGQGHLRIWFADQRYVIRDVATRPRITVNGRPVTWSLLGDGDEIKVRGLTLHFSLAPAAVPAAE